MRSARRYPHNKEPAATHRTLSRSLSFTSHSLMQSIVVPLLYHSSHCTLCTYSLTKIFCENAELSESIKAKLQAESKGPIIILKTKGPDDPQSQCLCNVKGLNKKVSNSTILIVHRCEQFIDCIHFALSSTNQIYYYSDHQWKHTHNAADIIVKRYSLIDKIKV